MTITFPRLLSRQMVAPQTVPGKQRKIFSAHGVLLSTWPSPNIRCQIWIGDKSFIQPRGRTVHVADDRLFQRESAGISAASWRSPIELIIAGRPKA